MFLKLDFSQTFSPLLTTQNTRNCCVGAPLAPLPLRSTIYMWY